MKKGLTELVFILDRSGSMGGLEADTIGGFNALLERQKKEEGEALARQCGAEALWVAADGTLSCTGGFQEAVRT